MIVFKLIDGEFAHTGAYVDILMDDMAFSSYSSAKIKSRNMTFNEGRSYTRRLIYVANQMQWVTQWFASSTFPK
jgi:Ca2+-dependent lipid-binding protein